MVLTSGRWLGSNKILKLVVTPSETVGIAHPCILESGGLSYPRLSVLNSRLQYTTWQVILKALLSKAFKITFLSVLVRRNGG